MAMDAMGSTDARRLHPAHPAAAALACSLLLALAACGGAGSAARPTAPTAPATPTADPVAEPTAPAAPPPTPGEPVRRLENRAAIVCGTANRAAEAAYDEGLRRYDDDDVGGAMDAYQRALLLDPRFCDAMDNLAVLYRRAGRVDEAIVLYERSLAVAPGNQLAWQNVGVAYRMREGLVDAMHAYQHLTVLAPDNPEGWYGVAQMALLARRPREVIAPARRAEALYTASGSPLIDDARVLIGLAASALDDQALVRATLEPLYERFSDKVDINLALARAYRDVDRSKAQAFLQRAAALSAPPDLNE